MKNLNIGIIGHGFIGQAVVNELILQKNCNIRILDRNKNIYHNNIIWYQSDFRDKKSISNFINDLDIFVLSLIANITSKFSNSRIASSSF